MGRHGDCVKWITEAGGVAVLAHPLRYDLTANWMKRLLAAFKDAGGQGMEVVTGRNNPDEIKLLATYAALLNWQVQQDRIFIALSRLGWNWADSYRYLITCNLFGNY